MNIFIEHINTIKQNVRQKKNKYITFFEANSD